LREQIVKHGGTLQATYDALTVTHIITDDTPFRPVTLKALGIPKMGDIPPWVPTVTWSWVVEGHGRAERRREDDDREKARKAKKAAKEGKKKEEKEGEKKEEEEEEDWEGVMPHEFMHAAFHDRVGAGPDWNKPVKAKKAPSAAKGKGKAKESKPDSNDSNFSEGEPSGDESRMS
jgi:type IV secretory pathway VirB10-like protein